MSDARQLQAESRARIRAEREGDPSWVAFDDGKFALHIQYGGGAVIVSVGSGSEDIAAFREWLEFHWPAEKGDSGEQAHFHHVDACSPRCHVCGREWRE